MEIIFFQKEVHHYRLITFNLLQKKLKKMIVLYNTTIGCDLSEFEFYKKTSIYKYSSIYYLKLNKYVNKNVIIVLPADLKMLNLYLMFIYKIKGAKVILWGHGYSVKHKNTGDNIIADLIKKLTFKVADGFLTYTEGGKNYLKNLGLKENKIKNINNAVNFNINDLKEYNYSVRRLNLLILGRLIKDKNVDKAIGLFRKILELEPNAKLHIVGDGPEMENIKFISKNIQNIFLYGEIYDEFKLNDIFNKCSIHITAGYLGLNLLHVSKIGIRTISFNDGFNGIYHSPEFEYFKGTSSLVLANSDEEFIDSVVEAINLNKSEYESIRNETMNLAALYTVENMTDKIYEFLNELK